MMHCGYFDTTRNSNHSSFLTPTVVGERCSLPCQIFAESDPPRAKLIVPCNQYFICIRQMTFRSRYSCLTNISASRPAQNRWQYQRHREYCRQLHNGLFGRGQSHGLSAVAELLVFFVFLLIYKASVLLHVLCTYLSLLFFHTSRCFIDSIDCNFESWESYYSVISPSQICS